MRCLLSVAPGTMELGNIWEKSNQKTLSSKMAKGGFKISVLFDFYFQKHFL